MGKYLVKGSRIYTPKGVVKGGLVIEGKKIKEFKAFEDIPISFEGTLIDVGDSPVIPGLIDIHTHGAGGWSVSGSGIEGVRGLLEYLPKRGVTSFQPSIGGGSLEIIMESLQNLREAKQNSFKGTKILGIHMEGPFLNPEKKGAFKIEYLIKPSAELMYEFIKLSGDNIIHVTLAPELEGADEVIQLLVENNILVSGGHTNATIEETKRAIERGIRLSNHTSNAQSPIHHREPGALGGYLLDDRVYCELICDSFHVHPDMIKLIIKIKSTERVCMISDSIPAAGIEPGQYYFLGRKTLIDSDGWSRLPDGTIAGSTKDLLYGVKKMVKNLGFTMEEAVKMASTNPAKLSGFSDYKGSLEAGKDADIVILDKEFDVLYTFIEGEIIYTSDMKKDYLNPDIRLMRVSD